MGIVDSAYAIEWVCNSTQLVDRIWQWDSVSLRRMPGKGLTCKFVGIIILLAAPQLEADSLVLSPK
jgi:hypothetical protein